MRLSPYSQAYRAHPDAVSGPGVPGPLEFIRDYAPKKMAISRSADSGESEP